MVPEISLPPIPFFELLPCLDTNFHSGKCLKNIHVVIQWKWQIWRWVWNRRGEKSFRRSSGRIKNCWKNDFSDYSIPLNFTLLLYEFLMFYVYLIKHMGLNHRILNFCPKLPTYIILVSLLVKCFLGHEGGFGQENLLSVIKEKRTPSKLIKR